MSYLIRVGNYIYDYIVVNIILVVSMILVLPFYYIYVGIISFLDTDNNYKSLFVVIKTNKAILIKTTILLLILLGLLILTLFLKVTGFLNILNLISRYVLLFLIINLFIYPPILILNMQLTLKQLIINSLFLSLMYIKEYLIMMITLIIFIVILKNEFLIALIIYPIIQLIHYFTSNVLKKEKERTFEHREENI